MDNKATSRARNDNIMNPAEEKLAILMNDFELIAQAASHDLKDPLRQAIVDLETLMSNYSHKPLDDSAKANMQLTIASIALVVRRIELLRSYSRVVQNKKSFTEAACADIIQKALQTLQETIKARNAQIEIGAMPVVFGDGEQLVLLFRYLIDNALRFCPEKTPHIRITAKDKDTMWEFAIQDNGIGIDPVYRDFVFCIFQALNREESRSEGVGLTFGRKIVQNHGGDIRYESDGQNGTCFYFTLPKR